MAGRKKKSDVEAARDARRLLAESDLEEFIKLVHPRRWLGNIHREVISWWTSSSKKSHQLLLLPRDHMKSALVAYRCAWELTKNPSLRILYISSTSNLAVKQLKFIKDILTSDNYRLYWPDMVLSEEAKREQWTQREISVDHPQRKADAIRDPSIFTAGLTSNIVGLHSDITVLDDVVVVNNAYLEDTRAKVLAQYGYLTAVEGVGSQEWVVGTRYHPLDLYSNLMEMEVDEYDEFGNIKKSEPLFDVFQREVETAGDGTGQFLWPRSRNPDGKWYGFDEKVLAEKRSKFDNKVHFRAQYYNNPQDVDSAPIKRDQFQYYDSNYLGRKDGQWFFKRERLNVVAAIDFAYTTANRSDSTSIVVIGVDGTNNYYILEIDRFKTDKISEYFNHILATYNKWGYRKIRCEITAAQSVIVKDLKENYIRKYGLSLAIDESSPSRWQGTKEERILTILEPKYANRQIWHYQSGNTQLLEEELLYQKPPHDDIKDALSAAVDFAVPPLNMYRAVADKPNSFQFHSRYGGVA